MKHTVKFLTLAATLIAVIGLAGCSPNVDAKPQDSQEQNTQQETWDDGVVTTEPSCTTEGVKTYTCTNGKTKTETIPALGHDYENWIVTKEATCTEDGEKKRTCKREGCGHFETEVIPAAHDYQGGYCEREGCTDPWEHIEGKKLTFRIYTSFEEFKKQFVTGPNGNYDICNILLTEDTTPDELLHKKTKYLNWTVIYDFQGNDVTEETIWYFNDLSDEVTAPLCIKELKTE